MSVPAENLPLPRRDNKKEKLTRCVENLTTAPLPRCFSEKCFELHGCDCFGLEMLLLIDAIG
jgi:hypothetical protein